MPKSDLGHRQGNSISAWVSSHLSPKSHCHMLPSLPSEASAKPNGYFLYISSVSQPNSILWTCYKYKATEKVYKSHSRVESTHTQPSTLVLIYVPVPVHAMGSRQEAFLPGPAYITEALRFGVVCYVAINNQNIHQTSTCGKKS